MNYGIGPDLIRVESRSAHANSTIRLCPPSQVAQKMDEWEEWCVAQGFELPSASPLWMRVFQKGFGHQSYCIEQSCNNEITALIPLSFMKSFLFGRFLVSLPYLNVGGVLTAQGVDPTEAITAAADLADKLDVRHLELRHQTSHRHERINHQFEQKVHMRLDLPEKLSDLWDSFRPKVRNQVRKGTKSGVTIEWGREELLDDFYSVFSRNMRDLGTPVFSTRLFRAILEEFPDSAEFCIARLGKVPVAGALLIHGRGITEVPSASSLRPYNGTSANMLMYWHLLTRAVERGQRQFDFGRSTEDSPTYAFKKQWGARPHKASWQFYVRSGSVHSMRPESGRYSTAIRIWRRLPVALTNVIGPSIIRGVP